jgi:hypothetical protein
MRYRLLDGKGRSAIGKRLSAGILTDQPLRLRGVPKNEELELLVGQFCQRPLDLRKLSSSNCFAQKAAFKGVGLCVYGGSLASRRLRRPGERDTGKPC